MAVPDTVKLLRGTLKKSRVKNDLYKTEKPEIPKPEKGVLNQEARKHYDRLSKLLVEMKTLTKNDVVSLELLCQNLAEYYRLKRFLDKNGHTYKVVTREGEITYRRRPESQLMQEHYKNSVELLKLFGLDPTSRNKVNTVSDALEDNKWSRFAKNPYEELEN